MSKGDICHIGNLTYSFHGNWSSGCNINQALNILQGRAVSKDDLVRREGVSYKAWTVVDFKLPWDDYDNYKMRQYDNY